MTADRLILVTALHCIHHQYNIPLDYQLLDSCYREELDKINLGKLRFRIDSIAIDSAHYKYVEDFAEDNNLVRLHSKDADTNLPYPGRFLQRYTGYH